VFALDVFDENLSPTKMTIALMIHLLPAGVVLAALAVTWWKESLGTLLFIVLGVMYIATTWERVNWSAQVIISGPLFFIAALFLTDWFARRQGHELESRPG
jgi:hypothetical protein